MKLGTDRPLMIDWIYGHSTALPRQNHRNAPSPAGRDKAVHITDRMSTLFIYD